MKPFISTAVYGFLNYVLALTLMASPWLFGFTHAHGGALLLPVLFGWVQLIMAIFSKHEWGFLKVFPVPTHCFLDVVGGFILMTSPFLYGYYIHEFWPQFLLGLVAVLLGIFTKKSPLTDEPQHVFRDGLGNIGDIDEPMAH